MKYSRTKVEDSSNYWCDFEGEKSVYYHFVWNRTKSIDYLKSNTECFINEYIILAEKYRIAIPLNPIDAFSLDYEKFSGLYKIRNGYCFPSEIFLNETSNSQKIISVSPIIRFKKGEVKDLNNFSPPIRIELFNNESEIKLLCYIDNDMFNFWLDNKKTKSDPKIGGQGRWVDNSDLAYLNSPRLNSFLKGLKLLCVKYRMDDFKFENLGLEDYNQEGVLFKNEIIYYEDIFDLLLPNQQIVND